MKLIQFLSRDGQRSVGIVESDLINTLTTVQSVYDLFFYAESNSISLSLAATSLVSGVSESYGAIIEEKRILLPLDHPDPYHCWITGTGLTHTGSAASRNAMHEKLSSSKEVELTDSLKMFQMGMQEGKMTDNQPGVQPEWFYKGNGLMAVPSGQELCSPAFALDGGEEPEIAGLYIINHAGVPTRIGFALGNEFSDHKTEKINYLYLAHSKLRPCAYGPEILIGDLPSHIVGKSKIIRQGKIFWEKEFLTGESNMTHNIANLEHHHFKYKLFKQPGDVHVHFFGTSVLSFADGITPADGDLFVIEADCFNKPLVNQLKIETSY